MLLRRNTLHIPVLSCSPGSCLLVLSASPVETEATALALWGPALQESHLALVAALQGSQVRQEAHGQGTPLLRLLVLAGTVVVDACVPSSGHEPEGLNLRVAGLQHLPKSRRAQWVRAFRAAWAGGCSTTAGEGIMF